MSIEYCIENKQKVNPNLIFISTFKVEIIYVNMYVIINKILINVSVLFLNVFCIFSCKTSAKPPITVSDAIIIPNIVAFTL